MPRMIDAIRAGGKLAAPFFVPPEMDREWTKEAREVVKLLQNPLMPVLVIDNVADYYYSSEQEHWDLAVHFPNLAPPYKGFWMEHRLPRKIHSKECGDTDMSNYLGKDARMGLFVYGLEPNEVKGEGELPEGTRWILWCESFINYDLFARERDIIAYGPHGSIFMAIDGEGKLLGKPWMQSFIPNEPDGQVAEILKSHIDWLKPSMLAVSFLHCKNVIVQDNAMDKPLAKKFRVKHGMEPCRWKTLVIQPLKQILQREGGAGQNGTGIQKAMHICRGYFRDYREGRGLFGKYHGQFFMPSVVRGSRGTLGPRNVVVKAPKVTP